MPKVSTPKAPESWDKDRHDEIEGFGLGKGFALFDEVGASVRGICRTFFPTQHGPAVSIELTEAPTVRFYMTNEQGNKEEIEPEVGELVNISLSPVELNRKMNNAMLDREIGIQYMTDVKTRGGSMKNYRVVMFAPAS